MNNITLTYTNKQWFTCDNLLKYYIYIEETYYAD